MKEKTTIEVRDLSRHFGDTKAVDGVSFTFGAGEVYGFVGPNGAGKTTTLRILATLDMPTDGSAYIDGVSVQEYPEQVRKLIGFVPDALPEHSDITVHEYLDFFGRAHGLHGHALGHAVEEVKVFTRLKEIEDKLLKHLSKGMKQRVSLGRALIHDPKVLLMDEPAAGLDPRARVEFRELVGALAEAGKAILVSSHILTELAEMCSGVVIIERGKILANGNIKDILDEMVPTRTLAIRATGDSSTLQHTLMALPQVQNVCRVGDECRVTIDDNDDATTSLLDHLMRQGIRIVEFRHIHADLEEIFMKVTKGEVQ